MLKSFNVSKKILPIPFLLPETSFSKKKFHGSIFFRKGTIMEKFTEVKKKKLCLNVLFITETTLSTIKTDESSKAPESYKNQ